MLTRLYELPEQLSEAESQQLMQETLQAYEEHIDRFLPLYIRVLGEEMLEWRAEGSYLISPSGRRWMDCLGAGGVFGLGFRHPKVVAAIHKQADRVGLSSRLFLNPVTAALAKKLCSIAPEGLDQVWFANSGTESLEAALKLARLATGRPGIVGTEFGYHGMSIATLSISGLEAWRKGTEPAVGGSAVIPFNDIAAVEAAITPKTAAIFVEPIQGEGGVIIPPDGYLKGLHEIADRNKCLLVLDEIQSGLGRTGKLFAFEHEGIRPDGVTIGKALSGGFYPVSAFLASSAVMDVFTPGIHGSTYGGNPLACAVASEALDVLVEEKLVERAAELGVHLEARLRTMKTDKVEAVRVRGLWAGVQLKLSAGPARPYCYQLKDRGMLCKDTHAQTIRLAPPLVITREEIDWAVDQLEAVLA